MLPLQFLESAAWDVLIDLGRRDIPVPEEHLDHPEVEHVGREGD